MHSHQHEPGGRTPGASLVSGAPGLRPSSNPAHRLQRRYGNRQTRAIIQAKLAVGSTTDPLEREADRISRLATGGSVQRAPEAVGRVPATAVGESAGVAVEQGVARARGGGRPVPTGVRQRMERVSGADLRGVRVHVGAESDRMNHALGARAFTVGADVFVRRSDYRPGTTGGDALLGHELTHTIQQGAVGDHAGDHANAGDHAHAHAHRAVQRKDADDEAKPDAPPEAQRILDAAAGPGVLVRTVDINNLAAVFGVLDHSADPRGAPPAQGLSKMEQLKAKFNKKQDTTKPPPDPRIPAQSWSLIQNDFKLTLFNGRVMALLAIPDAFRLDARPGGEDMSRMFHFSPKDDSTNYQYDPANIPTHERALHQLGKLHDTVLDAQNDALETQDLDAYTPDNNEVKAFGVAPDGIAGFLFNPGPEIHRQWFTVGFQQNFTDAADELRRRTGFTGKYPVFIRDAEYKLEYFTMV
ncbi:DUF4157 domain-containing protein [Solwaraspora sp. WMMD937]|uniref:eCIS core domain-containing protein n=1 Tax=Solwaraspora sp. WMMD937 TaxID=3016090 RepID=UPI00249B47D7|nr:DUF4157 domain-containing protein [Solwaraspora sp. WMMD937]WFE23956.1 DUF4157 domain-containing protein [Solwaraspora sp. WMMD937]